MDKNYDNVHFLTDLIKNLDVQRYALKHWSQIIIGLECGLRFPQKRIGSL